MNFVSTFSEKLQEQLDERNLKPEDLEELLGFSNSNVYKWLRGESVPNLSSLIKLSDFFSCTLDYLSGRAHENHFSSVKSGHHFQEKLNQLIKEKDGSAYRCGKNADIPRNTLHYWLKGRSEPLLDKLIRLADYFDCTIDELLKFEN